MKKRKAREFFIEINCGEQRIKEFTAFPAEVYKRLIVCCRCETIRVREVLPAKRARKKP